MAERYTEFFNAILDTLFGFADISNIYNSIKNILMFTAADDLSMVNGIYQIFVVWGFYILLIFVLMEIYELFMRENPAPEQMIKVFLKCGFGVLLLEQGGTLLSGFISLGNLAITKIAEISGLDTPASFSSPTFSGDVDLFTGLLLIVPALLLLVASKISEVIIKVQLWTRKIEILCRMAFTSIAVADLFGEIGRSGAIRYLKKLLALFLQGGAIVGIYAIIHTQQKSLIENFDTSLWVLDSANPISIGIKSFSATLDLLTMVFVLIGATSVAKQIVNDVMGV